MNIVAHTNKTTPEDGTNYIRTVKSLDKVHMELFRLV
jgi:hypothetical protein